MKTFFVQYFHKIKVICNLYEYSKKSSGYFSIYDPVWIEIMIVYAIFIISSIFFLLY